jgi:hypothetical protein
MIILITMYGMLKRGNDGVVDAVGVHGRRGARLPLAMIEDYELTFRIFWEGG